MNDRDIEKLQIDFGLIGGVVGKNAMKIKPGKNKAVSFTRARLKDPLNYSSGDQRIPEASSYQYLLIITRSDLSWTDQVNYIAQKAWKALHFITRTLKKGNSNTKSLAYTPLVCPILEYGVAFWDLYREGQVNALDRKKEAKFANHTNDSVWETLGQSRKIARICARFKAYTGERASEAIGDRLQGPCYLSRDGHDRKIWGRKQGTDTGKYSLVNRTIKL
jgi:hypothetical protein